MSTLKNRLPWILGFAGVAGLGYWAFNAMYAAPRRDLLEQISLTRANIRSLEKTLDGEFELREKAKEIKATTLGDKQDTVQHRFRTGLSRIGEQEGLQRVVVDHGQPLPQASPLLSTKGVPSSLKQSLRKTADFRTIRGSLKGTGTLEQVLRVISVAQAQPWLHRVDGFSIKPVGNARDKFELRLDVATLFVPDLPGDEGPEPQIVLPPPQAEPLWRQVAAKNVFKAPTVNGKPAPRPVEVAAAPQAPQPSSPPPQVFAPYDDWKLTGVVVSGRGAEAFFMNLRTGAKLTVEQGGQVLDAVFVDGQGDTAVLEIGGKRFEVSNGQTLAHRRPV